MHIVKFTIAIFWSIECIIFIAIAVTLFKDNLFNWYLNNATQYLFWEAVNISLEIYFKKVVSWNTYTNRMLIFLNSN